MDLDFRYLEHSNRGVKDLAEALPSNPFMKQTLFYVLTLPCADEKNKWPEGTT